MTYGSLPRIRPSSNERKKRTGLFTEDSESDAKVLRNFIRTHHPDIHRRFEEIKHSSYPLEAIDNFERENLPVRIHQRASTRLPSISTASSHSVDICTCHVHLKNIPIGKCTCNSTSSSTSLNSFNQPSGTQKLNSRLAQEASPHGVNRMNRTIQMHQKELPRLPEYLGNTGRWHAATNKKNVHGPFPEPPFADRKF